MPDYGVRWVELDDNERPARYQKVFSSPSARARFIDKKRKALNFCEVVAEYEVL